MQSHPSWVCGLKQVLVMPPVNNFRSHPSWVCGLKRLDNKLKDAIFESHPSWVCGLKPRYGVEHHKGQPVTPFVGVWIETSSLLNIDDALLVTPFVGVWIETGLQ